MKAYHHAVVPNGSQSYVWEQLTDPFDELLLTWNGSRPSSGLISLFISLKVKEWSPWPLYAQWGASEQYGAALRQLEPGIRLFQDTLEMIDAMQADAFRVQIQADDPRELAKIRWLHVCVSKRSTPIMNQEWERRKLAPINLPVPLISQVALGSPLSLRICSPTSTTAALRFLLKDHKIDPLEFALKARDLTSDIFGNWSLNVAQAAALLGEEWQCWVQRLHGFKDVYTKLQSGVPVVVSIKGPLTGGAMPYEKGHLLVIKGYDSMRDRVLCMDPAFPTDPETEVDYDYEAFLQAWGRRRNLAYVFSLFNTKTRRR